MDIIKTTHFNVKPDGTFTDKPGAVITNEKVLIDFKEKFIMIGEAITQSHTVTVTTIKFKTTQEMRKKVTIVL